MFAQLEGAGITAGDDYAPGHTIRYTPWRRNLSAGNVDVTAYALRTASGGLNLMLVNKDTLQNLTLTIQANQRIETATAQTMTGPSLSAISGVTIQGAAISRDGSFAPASPVTLAVSASQTTCYVPALSATLISIT